MTLATHLLSEAWLLHLAATYGAWAVLVSVTLEGAGLPVPSESILIAVAAVAAGSDAGAAAVVPVVLAGTAGAVLGDNLGYALGRVAGEPLMKRLGLSSRRQRLGRYLFLRYGGRVVFVARFVSILRTCVSLLAGTTRMPWPRFFAFNLLGGCIWAATIGFGAYALGQRARSLSWATTLALAAIVVAALAFAAIFVRRKEQALQAEADRVVSPPSQPNPSPPGITP